MRIILDTENKVVTLLHEVNFKDIEQIKKIIGDGWKDWKVQPFYQYPIQPWIQPYISYDSGQYQQPLVTFTAAGN